LWTANGHECPRIEPAPHCPVVNIAGSRESRSPGIQQRVKSIVLAMLTWKGYVAGGE